MSLSAHSLLERHVPRKAVEKMRFLRSWITKPLQVGAVSPSSRFLARVIASYVDPKETGKIIEIGPGTGPVTKALLARGIAPERLILVEYDPAFVNLLRHQFPGVTVIQGDAYALGETLQGFVDEPVTAIVSSLPLMTRPMTQRQAFIRQGLALLYPHAPFIQFSYALQPPVPKALGFTLEGSKRVWRNVPPARVWIYRSQP